MNKVLLVCLIVACISSEVFAAFSPEEEIELERQIEEKLQSVSKFSDVLQDDPYAFTVFKNALQNGIIKEKSIRVNIVGNFNQGKTSLLRRLLGQSTDEVQSTNGVNIERIVRKISKDGEFLYEGRTSDEQKYVKIISAVAESDKQTNKDVKQNILAKNVDEANKQFQSTRNPTNSPSLPNEEIVRSINRPTDTVCPAEVSDSNATKLQRSPSFTQFVNDLDKVGQKFMERIENDIGTRINYWDFGGQFLFYATHSLFHSRKAIYLLVFDLSTELDSVIVDKDYPITDDRRDMQYYFEFWMNSIHTFVGTEDGSKPTVVLVGTHKDKVPRECIDEYFEEIRKLFDGTVLINHISRDDFAVNNTVSNDDSLCKLRRFIIDIGNQNSELTEVPANWIPLEKSIDKHKQQKVLTISQLISIDSKNEFPIDDLEEIKLFLRYHHDKGTCIYFDEPQLSEYVFVDPQFVVDAFRTIITCPRFIRNDPAVRPLLSKLLSEAKLDDNLIELLWKTDPNLIKHKQILLMALKKHNILSEVTKYDEETDMSLPLGWYIVPSLLKKSVPLETTECFLQGRERTVIRFIMKFKNSTIVPLLYHRLLSACVGKWSVVENVTQPMIFQNMCVVRVDRNHAGVLQLNLDCVELWLVSLSLAAINCQQVDRFRRFAESVVKYEVRKLRQPRENYTRLYSIFFKCNDESHGVSGSKKIDEMEDDGNEYLICPDILKSHNNCTIAAAKSQWFTDFRLTDQEALIPLTDDKMLSKISRNFEKDWEKLGLQLGLLQEQIEHIIEKYPNSASMRRFLMLKQWRDEFVSDATMGKLVDAMKTCSTVDVDWNEMKNLIEENKENEKISGQPFRKAFDNTLSEAMMEILTEQMKSVGVLMSGDNMVGTVFRVGKACIMTALHVITCILGPADNGSGDTSKLEDNQICVHFYKSGIIGNVNPPVDIFYLRKKFIFNSDLDVAILEISNPEKLPCKMRLSRSEVDVTDVSLIGYGNPNNAHKKVLDPRCELVYHQSERMQLAFTWLMQNESFLRSRLQNYAGLIDIGYQGYDNPSVLLFDCFINHGASGAPILSNNNEQSVAVVGVLTHGLPEFYFKLPDQVQKDVPDYCKLELGAKMKYIYDWIAQSHPELVHDFFN